MHAKLEVTISEKTQTHYFQVPSLVTVRGENEYTPRAMACIELAGATSAVRSAWAHIVKNRESGVIHATGITIYTPAGDHVLHVRGKTKYTRTEEMLTDKLTYITLVSPGMGPKERLAFPDGTPDKPSMFFMDAMRRNVQKAPVLREWAAVLWKRGIEKGCIQSLQVFATGVPFYAWTLTDHHLWSVILKEAIEAGEIQ